MSKTAQYADLGKEPLEFAKRGFPEGASTKILYETKTPLGLVLKPSAVRGPKGLILTTEEEYKWKVGNNPVAFKGKVDNLTLGEASITVSDVGTAGTEVKPFAKRANVRKGKDSVLETTAGLQLGFANESLNLNGKVEALVGQKDARYRVDGSLVVQAPSNVFWGASLKYVHHPNEERQDAKQEWDYNVKVHWVQPASSLTAAYEVDEKTNLRNFNFTFFNNYSSDVKVATQFSVLPESQCTVTADQKWDASTSVKSKLTVGAESRVGVAYTQTLSSHATVTLGADLSVNKLFGGEGKDDHAFGVELKLKE
jgi:hypothetical protein